jgi:SAM-dependent methyltransferase
MVENESSYYNEEFIADLYDLVVPYRNRPDVGFFVDKAAKCGGAVLEVGCGTGRVLIPTARAGIDITGLDSSETMLARCRQRLEDEPPDVRSRARLVQADMRDFDLRQTFRLITLPFRPFQHLLTVEDQLACLATLRRHLADDGQLILDLFNPWLHALTKDDLGVESDPEAGFTTADGRRVLRTHKIVDRDLYEQIVYSELIYYVTHPDGHKERLVHAFPLRYLFRFEVGHLLARSGFEVAALYSDYDRSPYGAKYPGELIFVARKTGTASS